MGDKLLLNLGAKFQRTNLLFDFWNFKIVMATFRTCQCQDVGKVLKSYEWRFQGF